jgi:hypothetical protein
VAAWSDVGHSLNSQHPISYQSCAIPMWGIQMEDEIIYSNSTLSITKEKLRKNGGEFKISEISEIWIGRSSHLPMAIFIFLSLSIVFFIILSIKPGIFQLLELIAWLSIAFPPTILFILFLISTILYFLYAMLSNMNRGYILMARISDEIIQIIESNDYNQVKEIKHIIEIQNQQHIK